MSCFPCLPPCCDKICGSVHVRVDPETDSICCTNIRCQSACCGVFRRSPDASISSVDETPELPPTPPIQIVKGNHHKHHKRKYRKKNIENIDHLGTSILKVSDKT